MATRTLIINDEGHGIEKDKKKEMFHLEEAAISGHILARKLVLHVKRGTRAR